MAKTILRTVMTERENTEACFSEIFKTAQDTAERLNVMIKATRRSTQQTMRSNVSA